MIHSYPWYFADWLQSETRFDLSLSERGLYRDLLDLCYQDGSIPYDERRLRLMAACGDEEFTLAWEKVKSMFTERDGRLYNEKVSEVRGRIEEWHEGRRRAGRKGSLAKAELKLSSSSASSSASAKLKLSFNSATSSAKAELKPTTTTTTTTNNPLPPAFQIPDIAARIFDRHIPEKRGGSMQFIEQVISQQIGDAVNPESEIQRMDSSHIKWCELWAQSEARFTPKLTDWISTGNWQNQPQSRRKTMDAPPPLM